MVVRCPHSIGAPVLRSAPLYCRKSRWSTVSPSEPRPCSSTSRIVVYFLPSAPRVWSAPGSSAAPPSPPPPPLITSSWSTARKAPGEKTNFDFGVLAGADGFSTGVSRLSGTEDPSSGSLNELLRLAARTSCPLFSMWIFLQAGADSGSLTSMYTSGATWCRLPSWRSCA